MLVREPQLFPNLIEVGTRSFLQQSLKNAHIFKNNFYNTVFNVSLFVFLLLAFLFTLSYKYKGKLTVVEKQEKSNTSHQYVLEKIKIFQTAKRREEQALITGLPQWDN
tara:strand:+ start:1632 stop:1955 length:324 start_codon:yes stop_codon:yes gene_type:complete